MSSASASVLLLEKVSKLCDCFLVRSSEGRYRLIEFALLGVGVVFTLAGLVRKVINGRWTAAR